MPRETLQSVVDAIGKTITARSVAWIAAALFAACGTCIRVEIDLLPVEDRMSPNVIQEKLLDLECHLDSDCYGPSEDPPSTVWGPPA